MGWASYFEDICRRRFDDSEIITTSINGPAGSPIRQLPDCLLASFQRLASHLTHNDDELIRRYEQDQWKGLSEEMDRLELDVAEFNRSTVLAAQSQVLAKQSIITDDMKSVIDRAETVSCYLSRLLAPVESELGAIHPLIRSNVISPVHDALINRAINLIRGWRALDGQTNLLKSKADELMIQLSGDVFERLMSDSKLQRLNKDKGSMRKTRPR